MIAPAGALLLIEHLNLNVASRPAAEAFYRGLGCSPQGGRVGKSLHANAGRLCQFHCSAPEDERAIALEGAQVWRGAMTLAYDGEEAVGAALERLQAEIGSPPLQGTLAGAAREGGAVRVTCPFGNRLLLRSATPLEREGFAACGPGRPGCESSLPLGIVAVSLPCSPGTSGKICDFYHSTFGMAVEKDEAGGRGAVLAKGGMQRLEFIETDEEVPYMGDHVAIYIDDFKSSFDRCLEKGLVWVNPRFKHLDETRTWEDALVYKQFRFKEIIDADGTVLLTQEHEVRMVEHPSCPLPK